MSSIIATLLLAFACLAGVLCQEPIVNLQITQSFAKRGENVTLQCEVQNLEPGSILILSKSLGSTYDKNRDTEIAVNGQLVSPYKDLPDRFYMRTSGTEGATQYYFFHIYNAQYSDSARYICVVFNTNAADSKPFEVYRNTEELFFNVNGTRYDDGDTVDLEDGDVVPLNCTADKVMPQPSMHLLVGNDEMTSNLKSHHGVVTNCVGVESVSCLLHFHYNKTLHTDGFKASYAHNGKALTCKALILDSNLPPVESSVRLNVTFSPVFQCQDIYKAQVGNKFTVSCPFFFNPALDEPVALSPMDRSWIIKEGGTHNGISLLVIQAYNDKPALVQVVWNDVKEDDFKGLYQLSARNSVGGKLVKFRLSKIDDVTGEGNSGTTFSLSLFSLVLMSAVHIFLSH